MANETASGSGFSDAQLEQIRQIAEQVASDHGNDLAARLDTLDASLGATVSEVLPSALASVAESRSGVVQNVSLSDEQWSVIQSYFSFSQEALTLQNALLLFTLLFSAALLGMRFFSEFTRGFRRG